MGNCCLCGKKLGFWEGYSNSEGEFCKNCFKNKDKILEDKEKKKKEKELIKKTKEKEENMSNCAICGKKIDMSKHFFTTKGPGCKECAEEDIKNTPNPYINEEKIIRKKDLSKEEIKKIEKEYGLEGDWEELKIKPRVFETENWNTLDELTSNLMDSAMGIKTEKVAEWKKELSKENLKKINKSKNPEQEAKEILKKKKFKRIK